MKIHNRLLAAAVASMFIAGVAVAAESANSTAGATIVNPIAITNSRGLHFGEVGSTTASGTVTLPADGTAATRTGGAQVGNSTGRQTAQFTVTGDPNATFAVTLPTAPVTLEDGVTPTPNSMTCDTFTKSDTGTLDGSGNATFTVGATLNVGVSQTGGAYSGSFNVSVAYN